MPFSRTSVSAWLSCIVLLIAASIMSGQNTPTIRTVAGGGPLDNGLATNRAVGFIFAVATDSTGNLFISDYGHNRVRKVDTTGVISTVAGNGTPGFSGDGGPAANAEFSGLGGVKVDGQGNLFIVDTGNNRVRKVDSSGIITTIAGNGTAGFSGDGGPATSASLNDPLFISLDSAGDIFITDGKNFRVRKVDTRGVITTIAGNGTRGFSGDGGAAVDAEFSFLAGVAVDGQGNIFISDAGNARVRKVDIHGIISTFAGTGIFNWSGDGGPAINAGLNDPAGLSVDVAGNVFIADCTNQRIRRVDTNGIINTVAGNGAIAVNGVVNFIGDGGPATSASLNGPNDVAIDPRGGFYIADSFNFRVRTVAANAIISTAAGTGRINFSGDGGAAANAMLDQPRGVAVDSAGNIFIADSKNDRVRRVNTSGVITTVALGFGFQYPQGMTVDTTGNLFLGANDINVTPKIFELDISSTLTALVTATAVDVALARDGILFVNANCIQKLLTGGNITTVAGLCDVQVRGFSGDGGPAINARFNSPTGVAVDSNGNYFIADYGNNRVRKVDTNGIINTIAGNGTAGFSGDGGPATNASLNHPSGIRILGGNLFIADSSNQRIRKIDQNGTITTVAGNGVAGFSGDGGPATSASLNFPFAVALSPTGNLFIADNQNSRIREVTFPDFSLTSSPSTATIKAGQSATFTLTASPVNGFTGSISFACSGLPALAACTFNPATVVLSGKSATVTLTVTTSATSATLNNPQYRYSAGQIPQLASEWWGFSATLALLGFVGTTRRRRNGPMQRLLVVAWLTLVLVLIGCGGGGNPPPPQTPTPPAVSTITVAGTSSDGSIVNSATISLTITH